MERLLERITVDPNMLAGKPVIRGTRIPVYLIVELLAAGTNMNDVVKEYPELQADDVKAALLYASKLLEREITVALQGPLLIQLLVDENVPISVMEWLKNRGLNARRVSDVGLKGAKDEEVARYAIQNDMLILTLDTDFAYIYHDVFRGSLGIVVVRVKPPTAIKIIETLDKTFRKVKLDEFDKKPTIITERRARIVAQDDYRSMDPYSHSA